MVSEPNLPPQGNNPNLYGIKFENNEQRLRFDVLTNRAIVNSQFIDVNYMTLLGFWDELELLFSNVGMIYLGGCCGGWATHVDVTLEFLSILKVEKIEPDHYAWGSIDFQLFNKSLCLTINVIRRMVGLRYEGRT